MSSEFKVRVYHWATYLENSLNPFLCVGGVLLPLLIEQLVVVVMRMRKIRSCHLSFVCDLLNQSRVGDPGAPLPGFRWRENTHSSLSKESATHLQTPIRSRVSVAYQTNAVTPFFDVTVMPPERAGVSICCTYMRIQFK